jgi:hypothetical protein
MTTTETVTIPLSYHTPGPWGVRKHEKGFVVYYSDGEIRSNTAQCYDNTVAEEHGTAEANSLLIAAAPDLLDALQTAETALTNLREVQRWDHPSNVDPYGLSHLDEGIDAIAVARAAIAKATRTGGKQ